mmetsp:Transcript_24089/g.39857  ORF Transcript_24089/g.39857 Transcript_24089/m.39857 type:complete len:104 (+) Transcript_24089:882-1193(+)
MFQGLPSFAVLRDAGVLLLFIVNIFADHFDVVKSRTTNQRVGKDGSTSLLQDYGRQFHANLVGGGRHSQGFVPAFIKLAPYDIISSLTQTDKIPQAVTGKSAL